jgi:altronate dehydratase large subunit
MNNTFMGYKRENGSIGIRNYVLIIPAQKVFNLLAQKISDFVPGSKSIIFSGDSGRSHKDRLVIYRVLTGLGLNPNTASVLILGTKKNFGYEETKLENIVNKIKESGKRVETLMVADEGGFYKSLGKGVELVRDMVREASKARRDKFDLSYLNLSIKCGFSDATSGITGNPVVGMVSDKVVNAGGKAFFSETIEVIGAENVLVKRAKDNNVAQKIFNAVDKTEKKAKGTGEDIRSTNPVPENIAGGLSTLEEKSLGAIIKSGSSIIEDVIEYAERREEKGLYFMDAGMSSLSLAIGFAACGAHMMIFQMGGSGLSGLKPLMPAYNSGIVIPIIYVTGNNDTYERAKDNIDFNSGILSEGNKNINEVSDELLKNLLEISSGTKSKMETINYQDPIEIFFEGPVL